MVLPFRSVFGCAVAYAFLAAYPAAADVHVSGHVRSNGTYVAPHYRSNPDGNFYNNWSTKGNFNPHTGAPGTRVTPPNRQPSYYPSPSYSSPSYASPPASPGSPVTAPSYTSPSVPPIDASAAHEAARRAAEAVRAAEIAAAAKQYSDAKAQALATAKQNSEQRRKAFSAELESERAKGVADYEAHKAELIAQLGQNEPAAVESDKAELRKTYRELIERFNQEQIAEDKLFKEDIERQRRQLAAASEATEARAAAIIGRAELSQSEIREYLQRYDAIQRKIAEHNQHAWPDTVKSEARSAQTVRAELANRIKRRQTEVEQQLSAMKSAHDRELGVRIAKLESDFERAEGERFAADQERAERRFLAYAHGDSIDRALDAEPVAYVRPAPSLQSSGGAALTLTVVAALGFLLAVGAILSARSKPIECRHLPHRKG